MAIRKGENKAVPSCAIVISDFSTKVHDTPVIVYPTQAPRHAPVVTIAAQQRGTYAIYSFTGTLITEGNLIDGDTQVRLPAVNGMYFIHTTLDQESQTHKVLIY